MREGTVDDGRLTFDADAQVGFGDGGVDVPATEVREHGD